jgi:hypothetical protein
MSYKWAENKSKLQRAIERVKMEQQPLSKREKRIRELYISYGGRISLEDLKEDIENEKQINDTTINSENNKTTSGTRTGFGESDSFDDSVAG